MSSKDFQTVWANCLKIIKDNVNLQSFKTWFEPIEPVKLEDEVLTIQVPSQFFYEWLEEHYVTLLRKTIKRELGNNARLEYRIVVENSSGNNSPFTIDYPNYNTGNNKNPEVAAPLVMGTSIKNPFVIPGLKKVNIESGLNANYNFDNFIEGDCNRLCRSAGYAVAQKPGGTAFNPLVIYGATGLGKSHLAQSIGNEVKQNFPNKTVLYTNAERFTNQFIESLKNNSVNDFVHFYQLIDVLIIDDIHFFANKAKTQDIFFHIFNHLHQESKQIILTSDRPPRDLEGVEERLLSRFKWGLSADLQAPDFETRVAILEKKMYADGIELPKDVVEFVAYNITNNVRELEGALVSLLAQASLNKKQIDLDLAKKIVKNFVKNMSREVSIDFIQKAVCDYFEVPVDKLKEKTRKRQVVQARQLSMYLSKNFTKHSLKAIGKHFGGRDHSTVIHSCQAIQNLMDTDTKFKESVDDLQKKIQMSIS
ncbi:MAG: chromosomal replication initiator protein DnaA [Chitinophagales bacterium]|jgi:chromosomal replication initiator protein|nr:chromosomal replication initiator protein DnaA [Bacteroidota bacterium]MBP8249389.1 chromosomal replication initiator protein DnaA [Chitinophagales bacterium]MBK9505698.1 chromosomal replication initiator protein DnaA [Bacteroidota bacterium]MBK9556373.1 chromosomal replication initiator protein DnaA [Bacteroidota bacterium]MBL0280784.1 chromosomal replication initiator protein DnaA [Bacteroidota bacterium]